MKALLSTLIGSEDIDMAPLALVVDDEAPVRELERRWLERWGFRVREACSAIEAFEMMKVEPASVVICDVKMSGHSGVWLVQQLCGNWPETSVIMASAADDMETILDCQRAGALDYVLKPFGSQGLHHALRRVEAGLREPQLACA